MLNILSKLTILLCIVNISLQFSENRVRLIDTYDNNLIFRGNEPVSHNKFLYTNLTQSLQDVSHKHNITLGNEFYLIDYSLLLIERSDINVEKDFFKSNPDKGEYLNHPTVGSLFNPGWFGKDVIRFMVEDIGSFDKVPKVFCLTLVIFI